MMMKYDASRDPALDVIRVTACFLVILLHVSAGLFYSFSEKWIIGIFYNSISRMCIPIFFMLSGYLLIGKKYKFFYKFIYKRILLIFIPFLFLICIYYIVYENNIYIFIRKIINNNVDYHFWYVYFLFGIYLIFPFIMNIFKYRNGENAIKCIVFIWIIFDICYPLAGVMAGSYHSFYSVSFIPRFLGYILLGGILNKCNFLYKKRWIVIWIVSTCCIFVSTKTYSYNIGKPSEIFFTDLSPFVFFQAFSFFVYIKSIIKNRNKIILFISCRTYWIYLIHVLIMRFIYEYIPITIYKYTIITIPIIALIVFFVSIIVSIPLYIFGKVLMDKVLS